MSELTTPLVILETKGGNFNPPNNPGKDNMAVLQSVLSDSIYIQWEVNNTYQAQFTAYDDGSEAFNLLEVQDMVKITDQWFMIKQIQPDYSGGITTVDVTLSHISNEISRIRSYNAKDPVDWGDLSPTSEDNHKNGQPDLQVPSDNDDDQTKEVTPQDILDCIFKNNNFGVTYQVIGKFNKINVDDPYASGSGKDYLDRIKEAWPDCVIYPDNLNIRVYSHDEFYKNYGNRIDYLHDTAEITLSYDSTDMSNSARLVGASYSQETTVDTGLPNGNAGKGAQAVINDAKKYLGVPYVWGGAGGARGGNPFSGMDCSSYVSQVYKDFGINIPAYVPSMEPYGHRVGTPQTGDMGFYGSPGASYHICLALDSTTMIYEPAPGQACKTQSIASYPPQWWERNDQMAAIVGASGGDDGDADNTTTDSKEMYYFAPFMYQNAESVKRWGVFYTDDITSDTIQKKDEMKKYADTQFKLNPDLEIDATLEDNKRPIAGELIRVEVKPKNFVTTVAVVGYQWYPYSKATQSTETLNSNGKNILDYDNAQRSKVAAIQGNVHKLMTNTDTVQSGQETWTESEAEQYAQSECS
ncbi:Peptidoglycan endopeptidase RipA [Limosilactobacillus oris]|nr:Peptidoglycan endopeptidase RipA [Limosilactobacillus oris]